MHQLLQSAVLIVLQGVACSAGKQRLDILEMLFAPALNEKDPQFLARMHESDLWQEDKSINSKYSLFSDSNFNDCDYHAQYPTTYHLRSELAHSTDSHDVRLVYLALHHLMKSPGTFPLRNIGNIGQ